MTDKKNLKYRDRRKSELKFGRGYSKESKCKKKGEEKKRRNKRE